MKLILFIILLLMLFNGCSKEEPLPHNLKGFLIYIEDIDGKGGTTSGNFGDIVAYDIIKNKEYIITNDNYYNEHPTYSSKENTILFESKRVDANDIAGLTAKTDLFLLKLNKKEPVIINFKDLSTMKTGKNYDLYQPVFDKSGNNFAFLTLSPSSIKFSNLFYFNSRNGTISLINDTLIEPLTYTFGENGSIIYFTSETKFKIGSSPNYIGSIDIKTLKEKIILPSKSNDYYYLGDELNNKLLYLKEDIKENYISINIFDLTSSKTRVLSDLQKLGLTAIKSPVFGSDSTIYFIGNKSKSEDNFDEDIYCFNIDNSSIIKVTNNGYIKESLSCCR